MADRDERESLPRLGVGEMAGRSVKPGLGGIGPIGSLGKRDRWGRFERLESVGEGGVGVVYKAWDPTLEREVALKVLRREGLDQQERLFREARAQARLEHPHICPVYEAGTIDGVPYLAMQYVEGEDLKTLAPRLTLEERIRLLEVVARAVHAAHRMGLVHRDLKPSNILVETREDGELHPYVMDFGLVRDEGASIVTQTGDVLGTPAYMAPEQVRGETRHLDRRTDVYSLGAVLYELLTGSPPFGDATPVQTIIKVAEDEPVRPRQRIPSLPLELEVIALKCLEKEPEARYGSARALAEELARFLDGEPIVAQPTGRFRRLVKKARKNRVSIAVYGVALLLVALAAGIAFQTRWQAATQARLAQRFAQDARDVEWMMRVAHMSPLHDIAVEKERVRERIGQVEASMQAGGKLAQAPGHFALGRGWLALGEMEVALHHLERAWESGLQDPELAFPLGLVTGRLYQRELELTKSIREARLREARRREVERSYRGPTLRWLRASRGSDRVAPAYLEGLIALYDGQYEEGLIKAREAAELFPWLYEARILEGDLHLGRAKAARERGDEDGAAEALEEAERAYVLATETGSSDVLGYEGLCGVHTQAMILHQDLDEGARVEDLERATAACEKALVVEPGRSEPRTRLAVAHRLWGSHLVDRGADPLAAFERAAEEAARAVSEEPTSSFAHESLGSVMAERARWEFSRGEDPRPTLQRALESLEAAAQLRPVRASTFDWVGTALRLQAWFEWARGLEPRESWERAIQAYRRAMEIEGRTPFFLSSMADLYAVRASYGVAHGLETRADTDRSIELYGEALAGNDKDAEAFGGLGTAYFVRAEVSLQEEIDPRDDVAKAEANLQRARELRPGDLYVRYAAGYAAVLEARYLVRIGSDPEDALARAFERFDECLRLNPRHAHAATQKANAYLLAAEARARRGDSPIEALRQAREVLARAFAADPSLGDAHLALGETELWEATFLANRGRPSGEAFARAAAALGDALAANRNDARTHAALAALALERARSAAFLGDDAAQRLEEARRHCDRALALNPRSLRARGIAEELAAHPSADF